MRPHQQHRAYARQTGETPLEAHMHPSRFMVPSWTCADDMRLCARSTRPRALSCLNAPAAILRRVTRSDGAAVPDDHVIVLFGALGDLSSRKLLPGLFHLDRAGLMPERYKVIGTSRKGGSEDDFRAVARDGDRRRGRRDVGRASRSG